MAVHAGEARHQLGALALGSDRTPRPLEATRAGVGVHGDEVRIAAASNFRDAIRAVALAFEVESGHETTLFPFKTGIAALVIKDGNEHFTIQYAEDWVNFEIKSIVELMPQAAGPHVPDAFTNTTDGRGITWGLSHFTNYHGNWKQLHAVLGRFDCDLSKDLDDPQMKRHKAYLPREEYFRHGLSKQQKERILEENSNRGAGS